MSYQQKCALMNLFNTVLIFGVYYFWLFHAYQTGRFEGPDAASLVGKSILVLIAGGIIVSIVTHILFNIVYAIVTNDAKPSFVVDERDKLIELRALRFSHYIMMAGFILSMVALALGQPPFMVFNLLVVSFAVAGIAESAVQLVLYRRGF